MAMWTFILVCTPVSSLETIPGSKCKKAMQCARCLIRLQLRPSGSQPSRGLWVESPEGEATLRQGVKCQGPPRPGPAPGTGASVPGLAPCDPRCRREMPGPSAGI